MTPLTIALVVATVLCALVAGLVFTFAVVVMPGLRALDDRSFLRAFQEVDGVIQRGDPLFVLAWVGSVLALGAAAVLGWGQLGGSDRTLLVLTAGLYFIGVQLPTFVVNIPLNNRLQAFDVAEADDAACASARVAFEQRWNRWNVIRTVMAVVTLVLLAVLLVQS